MPTIDDIAPSDSERYYLHIMEMVNGFEKRRDYNNAGALTMMEAKHFKYLSEIEGLDPKKAREFRDIGERFFQKTLEIEAATR